MVTSEAFEDPQSLGLRTEVSGEMLQSSSTSEMIFGVRALLAHVSRRTTLEPGDVLLTGTPWSTGGFRIPQRFPKPGDIVRCSIDGIGTLTNPVTTAAALQGR